MLPEEWIRRVTTNGLEAIGLYLGSYFGHVVDINDPENLGRVRVTAPELYPADAKIEDLPWAIPGYGPGGNGHGLWWPLEVGDQVWVRCRLGRKRRPVVVGTWWPRTKAPPGMNLDQRGFVTPAGWRLRFDDNANSVDITAPNGTAFIRVGGNGKVAIGGTATDEIVSVLHDLITALTQMTTPTMAGPQPPVNLADFVALLARIATMKE